MKALNRTSRTVIATVLAGGALLTGSAAFAQQDPMFVRGGPAVEAYGQPHMTPVDVSINIGWRGDRYYDGHRYWAHDEWMRRHPHDQDPRHYHDHEHRPPQHY